MFREIGYTDIMDVAFMAILLYFLLVFFKKSRAAIVLTGMIIIGGVYLVAQQFNLYLTVGMFRLFFAVILFAWVVIFQEEIRRLFEQVALWSLGRRFRFKKTKALPKDEIAVLVRTAFDLAAQKIGALIVMPGKNLILGHLTGGTELNGEISDALLKSIFDVHSVGHDGAVIIEGNVLTKFGVHLPLSKNLKKLRYGGTRHAAALGLAELSDALCLVVSEERGTVSLARYSDLREVETPEELLSQLNRFYQEINPQRERRFWLSIVTRNLKEKVLALVLAILLWFVQVYGSKIVYKTFEIPVRFAQPADSALTISVDPEEAEVTFSGPRRSLYFLEPNEVILFIKSMGSRVGTRMIKLSRANLSYPKSISLENIEPSMVEVSIKQKTSGE